MKQLATLVRKEFGERVFFLGLQGSYRRGEATEQSDIDVVDVYKRQLMSMWSALYCCKEMKEANHEITVQTAFVQWL